MRVAAICAIEMMSSGVTDLDGKPLQQSQHYLHYFLNKTRGMNLYCDYKGYNALTQGVRDDKGRTITLMHGHSLMQGNNNIVVGGVDAFKYYESVINLWYICWYAKQFNAVEQTKIEKYRPNLLDFDLISTNFVENYLNFSVYRKKNSGKNDWIMPGGQLVA